jgi:hypothetical protein
VIPELLKLLLVQFAIWKVIRLQIVAVKDGVETFSS